MSVYVHFQLEKNVSSLNILLIVESNTFTTAGKIFELFPLTADRHFQACFIGIASFVLSSTFG